MEYRHCTQMVLMGVISSRSGFLGSNAEGSEPLAGATVEDDFVGTDLDRNRKHQSQELHPMA